ncbi:hypothetical protein V6259_19190 [Marinomonas sp. TI.3.20]|uniref:hypothetical protein n=1 Tax=Marinomonas sp. TI.3.20 TaxID=3121296 RepID=UPI00311DA906
MDTQSKEDIDRLKQIGGLKSHIEKQKTSSRHSLLNAWDYISKAKLIHEIDFNMSAFCLITAEEEAATALIKLIKERGYNCPYNLNHRLHPHKAAVYFLIEAYTNFIIETNALDEILISGLNKDQLELRINLIHMGIDG